jgi:SAM-dependent methyltransferase
MTEDLRRRQAAEIEFWRDSPTEGPDSDSLEAVAVKLAESKWLLAKLELNRFQFAGAGSILELGAGQGWASCIVKRMFPRSRVIASDISPWAIASAPKWERMLEASLDGALACKSSEIPLDDSSVDLVFTFQAAHHFVEHAETLAEIHRVLRPGGVGLYLHEPSCPKWFYKAATYRANRRRDVPEDVFVHSRLLAMARGLGFEASIRFDPDPANREPLETVYFLVLSRLAFLCPVVPCTADYTFRKPGPA